MTETTPTTWTLESITAHVTAQHEETFSAWKEAHDAYDDPTHEEEFEETLERKYNEGYSDALEMVLGLLPEISRIIEEEKKEEGAGVLSYLSDLFEGVSDTDIWGDYFDEAETESCGACGELVEDLEAHFVDCDENPANMDESALPENHFSNPLPSFSEFLNSIKPLTVGELRQALEGSDDKTQILIGAPLEKTSHDWTRSDWWNVSHQIEKPSTDFENGFSAFTLYLKDDYDSRQF